MPAFERRLSRRRVFICQGIITASMLMAFGLNPGSIAYCDDPVFSGPQPGEKLTELKLQGVYDDLAGKEFDPIADAKGKPTLLVFVHKLTRPGLGLARGVTDYAKSLDEPQSFAAVAWLDDDKANAEQFLTRVRKSLNLKVPVGISVDGGEGPGSYGLNRNVELTVLIAKDNKVVANFALIQPSMSDGVAIAGAFAKLLDKQPPTMEELQKIAYPGRAMDMRGRPARGQARPDANPGEREKPAAKEDASADAE
ncbi:MAG: hypothetical protein KDB00_26810 [Planctomycetales bacterium]|nr:hypothetical protein [Planctomycetales bacterium]